MRVNIAWKNADWHRWFAWYPVDISDNGTQVAWLENVWRRYEWRGSWSGAYRQYFYRPYGFEAPSTLDERVV